MAAGEGRGGYSMEGQGFFFIFHKITMCFEERHEAFG